jgi:arylsulfatase A-like enzyme
MKKIVSVLLLLSVLWDTLSFAQAKTNLPNIIVIFMDDMGYGDIGANGAQGYQTPNIDRLAAEGMRFTNFYAAQPICTASRAAILTGCYPNRIGLTGALFPGSSIGLSSDEETIAELLKKKNYITAIIGKWHLGDAQKFLPLQHGFDQYFGIPYSNDMWPVDYAGKPVTDSKDSRYKYPALPLMEGNTIARTINTLGDMDMLTTWYTQRAVKFIEQNKNKPFFLYMPHAMVHVPLGVSAKFKGKSGQGMFGDVMMEVDWSVGEVMKALKKQGAEKNTLVIFTSDNGPWLAFGNHAGSAGGFRGGKMTSWEGGQREPCIMRWPGVIPAGAVNNGLACNIDLLPTFAAITGSTLPARHIDGINILSLINGKSKSSPRNELLYYYNKNSLKAVRKGDWKLVFPHSYPTIENAIPGKNGFPGKSNRDTTGLALYNLNSDPGERYNVVKNYPEVVGSLQQLADKAREDLGDDLTGKMGNNRRKPGKL